MFSFSLFKIKVVLGKPVVLDIVPLSIIESKFHGKSSGLDPSVSLFNSPIFYSNKQIKLIDKIHYKNFTIYIMDSKINSSTKKMIEVFQSKMNESKFRYFFEVAFKVYKS